MRGAEREVDYLVIGAGLAGLAFTDSLIAGSDATVLLVDRRHSPGGHWNDAYPFVRLHQPSAFYGVGSRQLGDDRIDDQGPNAGYYERATAAEVCHYFQDVLDEHLIPSGQVDFAPMTTCEEDGPGSVRLVSRLTGAERTVTVRRKVVDARYLESSIPATHTRSFSVDDDARCIPVNGLVQCDEPAGGYVVMGAGKTGMDACTWLLEQGVASDRITWVKPREPWLVDRGTLQPRMLVGSFIRSWAASIEAAATATSVADLFERLEACGALVRLDPTVEPTMYCAAILSEAERERLRSIDRVVRLGRVRRLASDRMVLEGGEVAVEPGVLFVDCTAAGLARPATRPMFEPGRIKVQGMREGSPSFNASLLGYLESTRDDLDELNHLAPPCAYPSASADWIRTRHVGLVAQSRWDQTPDVAAWVESSRLNISSGLLDHVGEAGVSDALGVYLTNAGRAVENLARFRVEMGDDLDSLRQPA